MSMMDAAANRLLQNYFEMLQQRGAVPMKCAEKGSPRFPTTDNLSHVMWMCREAQTLQHAEKKNRWIGFIQGCLWMGGLRTIEELKNEIIAALDETRLFEDYKRTHRTVYKQPGSLYCRMEGCREFAEYHTDHRTPFCKKHTPIPMELKP